MEFSRSLPDMVIHGHNSLRGDTWLGEDLREDAHKKVEVLDCTLWCFFPLKTSVKFVSK